MITITLDEFCLQWCPNGKEGDNYITRRFERNLFEFVTKAGMASKVFFQSSFTSGGFEGKKWIPRQSKWGKRFKHPVMRDYQRLEATMLLSREEKHRKGKADSGAKIYKKAVSATIETKALSLPVKGKRGGVNKSYAAVHNTDPALGLYTVNQHSEEKPVRRQFMGHSLRLDARITKLYPILFENIPYAKTKR